MKLRLPVIVLFMSMVLVPARSKSPQKLAEVVPAIKVGMIAPDFTLEDARGRKINLADEVKRQPVVLVFYRGYW